MSGLEPVIIGSLIAAGGAVASAAIVANNQDSPKPPKIPPVPKVPGRDNSSAIQQAGREARRRQGGIRGATILGGYMGSEENVAKKTLLGQ